jgi:hypothetical protein
MAILTNKNTQGTPLTALGTSGAQSIKLIPAPRVYVKTSDPLTGTVIPGFQGVSWKSNGVTPTGWTDLGYVVGNAKVGYGKKTKEVRTGIDNEFRAAYTSQKDGTIEFSLGQLDDITLATISGLSASVITAQSVVAYKLGQEDLNQMALLLVVQNKLDGKEWQFYNPNSYLNFAIDDTNDGMTLKVTGMLPFFTVGVDTKETMLAATIFA